MLEGLFSQFDSLLVLDTETTGINCRSDEIIELAVLKLTQSGGAVSREEMEHLTRVVNRKDMMVSEQALDDYVRTIEEEYTRTNCKSAETLLQLARQKKETGGYGG